MPYLTYLAVRTLVCLLQSLRLETIAAAAPWLAWVAADVVGIKRQVVEENLQRAFPQLDSAERDALARGMWQHLILLAGEVALAGRKIQRTNWRRYIRLHGADRLLRLLLSERPTVIVSGHFGNFELGNVLFGLLGVPTLAVARKLDNPYLDRWLRAFRGRTGQRMVDKIGGYDEIVATLEHAGTVSLLGDQYAGRRGCWVDFFGHPASTHKAIALFALHHDAPLVVATARRGGKPLHYDMVIDGIADPRTSDAHVQGVKPLTAWFTERLEAAIRVKPAQYWWVHRRWKDARRAANDE